MVVLCTNGSVSPQACTQEVILYFEKRILRRARILGMIYGRPPMVFWPADVPHPEIVDDDALSTEPYSANEAPATVNVTEQAYFVHSLKLSDILLDVLK